MHIFTPHIKAFAASVFLLFGILFQSQKAEAQCFQVYDGLGVIQATPYFIGCNGLDHTIFVQADIALGNYTIVWGDATANSTGASLIPPAFIQHTYAATVDTFNITITDNSTGCVTNGVVVLEEPVNASIQIPLGGVTVVCAPSPINFINSSTNVSSTTTFTWDFGDGTPPLVFNSANAGASVVHTYQKNTVSCETVVTLTAENYCSFGNPTTALFAPLMVYDVDTAVISATATVLCYPDTIVTFDNATIKNCLPEGNVQQRYEYWNLGDYWGLGYDSIIPWIPFDPPAQPGHTIGFPGIGSYTIMMVDSNMCGRDTAYQTITIIGPPTAGFTIDKDSACVGETVNITNTSSGSSNAFRWDFDDGNGFVNAGTNPSHSFNSTGISTITLVAGITGTSGTCTDTAQHDVYIKPSPVASFVLDTNAACDTLAVTIVDSTSGAIAWSWTFSNGNTSNVSNPPTQTYTNPGSYRIRLIVTHANGCTDREREWVNVYPSPTANFVANSVCQNEQASFTDLSNSPGSDPINSWDWDFGDGNTDTQQNTSNVYSNTGDYNVTLIVATPHCADTLSDSVTVQVTPTAAFSISDTAGCSPLTVVTTNTSTGATIYNWDFGNGFGSNTFDPTIVYLNNDTIDTNFTLTLIASTSFGCKDTVDAEITVYGGPEANFTHNSMAECGPVTVNFTNASNGGVSYLWDFGDFTVTSNLENPSHTFQNNTLFITNYIVTLVTFNSDGCTDTITQVITVYPEPDFPFSTIPDSGCSPLSVTFPAIIGAVNYNWDFGDGTTAVGQTPSHVFYNMTTNDQTFSVQLIATSPFGCKDTTIEVVTVYPEPTAVFTLSDTLGCGPLTSVFNNGSLNATNYQWTFGDGGTSTNSAGLFNHTYYNTTPGQANFRITLVALTAHGCADSVAHGITLHPPVFADFMSDSVGCTPLTINYNNITIGGNSYIWDFGDGGVSGQQDPSHTFYASLLTDTVYHLTMVATSSFGCADTIQDSITVHHRANASLATSVISGCTPLDVLLINNSYGFDLINLSFGDGNSTNTNFSSVSHTYINNQTIADTFNLELIANTNFGCADTATKNVVVFPEVQADFTGNFTGCTPLVVTYLNNSNGSTSYQWLFGNGNSSGLANPTQTFVSGVLTDTVYQTTLIATSSFGCADTLHDSVTVRHRATASLATSIISGCTPLDVLITNNSYGYDNLNLSYGDGGILITNFASVSHTFMNTIAVPDTFNLELITSTIYGCADTATTDVIVFPEVQAGFSGDTTGCSPLIINFQNNSSGSTSYQWDFGNGNLSNLLSPTETFTALVSTQTYTTSLVATSIYGCSDSVDVTVTVHPSAVASFSSNTISGCSPINVTFTNSSFDYDNLFWDFGDGSFSNSTSAAVAHYYDNQSAISQIHDVQLVATTTQGCNDTSIIQVEVYPNIEADVTMDSIGCSPFFVQFQNNSTGANNYLWDLGNGVISTNPSPNKTYINTGSTPLNIPVSLIVTSSYGCTDTYVNTILVYSQPVANFIATPTIQSFPNTVVSVSNLTTGIWNYNWNFGNNTSSVSQNPLPIDYVNIGDYTLTLIISNQYCSDTATQLVSILPPPPVADFSGGSTGCAPVTVTFVNNSLYGTDFLWDFGDGNTSIQQNPIYTYFYPGTYTVQLTVTGLSGTDSKTYMDYVEVYANAIANFDYQPVKVSTTGDKAFFYNQSANATIFDWNFGDGGVSTDENPIYQYTAVGEFPITLIANNIYNCPDTMTHATYILVEAAGEVEFPNAFVPIKGGGNGGAYDPHSPENFIFHPVFKGVDEYHLVIYNRWGELVFESFDINIGWDGYYRGEMSAQDVYVWKADVILVNGEQKIYTGDVTLLQ